MGRTVVIGDVHGCYEEFELLLDRVDPQPGDRVIQLGDLVNRGPNSHRAVQVARQHEIETVMGNHELRLLNARKLGRKTDLSPDDIRSMDQLTEIDWRFLESLPAWIEDAAHGAVYVHGGFLPKKPWQQQGIDLVTRVQMVDREGEPQKRSRFPDLPFWADLWHPPPFVVYGHTPRRHIYPRIGSLGIDTGCVYGGRLTAFILPERTLIQVDAFTAYASSRHI